MKFSAGMIVLNGMPWMPYILKNLYPVMDELIIVEGAVELAAEFATPDGHSLDETVSVIRAFPDPERKIKLIQKHGFWPEKTEMSQAYAEAAAGDYLWQVDVDEFYHQKDVLFLKQYLHEHPEYEAVSLRWYQFFGGFNAYLRGGRDNWYGEAWWRIFRWKPGYRYTQHRIPTVVNEDGVDVREIGILRGRDLAHRHGIYIYHYSYVFPFQAQSKTTYYERQGQYRWWKVNPTEWYKNHYERYTPWRVHLHRRPLSWLEPFKGSHPPEITALIQDLAANKIQIAQRDSADINRVVLSWRWRLWQWIGRADVILWRLYNRPIRALLRPLVRPLRARFFGYDYTQPEPTPGKWDYV
jgi:hypothetical protein